MKSETPHRGRLACVNRREFCSVTLAAAGLAPALEARATSLATPSRKWTVFVVQNAHIDLGYTDRQEVIADYHRGFIRQAVELALAPAQKTRARECQFKFTCEGFWSLEQFLGRATPAQQADLLGAMQAGLFEITAFYFHLTELLDMELLRRSVAPAAEFARRHGIPLQVAAAFDINGFSWGMADVLSEIGVRFLATNINPHHGGPPFGRPLVPFYWESPKGKRILVWSGMTYHFANLLGLMGGLNPDGNPGIPGLDLGGTRRFVDVADISLAERKLLPVLAHLEQTGYPYDFILVCGSGLYTDNSPPTDRYCEIIRQWNTKHGDKIRIETATFGDFFAHLAKNVSDIPVHRGEWTDWWSDGVAATPLDTLIFRNAQRARHLVTMLDPGHRVVSPERVQEMDRKLMLYAEHTFGYSRTSSASLLTHQVFLRKTQHAVAADELAGQALIDVLHSRGEGEFTARRPFEFKVINPLDRAVKTAVFLPADYWEGTIIDGGIRVVDDSGQTYPCQTEQSPRGRLIAVVVDLEANGEKPLRITQAELPSFKAGDDEQGFRNDFYRAGWNAEQGIFSLVEAATGKQLIAPGNTGLGCPVYQIFPGADRGAAAGALYRARKIPRGETTVGRCRQVKRASAGPVLERWEIEYDVPGATAYVLTATFYRALPQIELVARVIKTDVRDPEGMYAAFPVTASGGVWHLDKPGAAIRPGLDQLPKTCCDYYAVQSGAALVGNELGIALTTLDAPLVQLGKLRLWTYSTAIEPTGTLYSWLTNNKWETNFKISCAGSYEFRYILHAAPALARAETALDQCRAHSYPPLVVRK